MPFGKALAEGEHAENTIRKDFTPSEAVAIARAVRDQLAQCYRRGILSDE